MFCTSAEIFHLWYLVPVGIYI